MRTTNKFSNFGFFAGSPRQTHLVDAQGNIEQCKEDEIEVSIEEAIETNIEQINKDRVKALTRQKSLNTKPDKTHPVTLQPKVTDSPELDGRRNNRAAKLLNKMGTKEIKAEVPEREKPDEQLRVSYVPQEDVMEIAQMAGQISDDDGDGESEADFYKPVGLSPMKSRVETGT